MCEALAPGNGDPALLDRAARDADPLVDLAALLEPVYWPTVIGRRSRQAVCPEHESQKTYEAYGVGVRELVKTLDSEVWQKCGHWQLRVEASGFDANDELYMFLRLAPWERRERLRGPIAAGLLFRHMAEVIRRAFEEVHGAHWVEEDQTVEYRPREGRIRRFGSERPLDNLVRTRPYVAFMFGPYTGSAVRWYLEGDTEFFAADEILGDPVLIGVELVNLKGAFTRELEAPLLDDVAFRRFSMVSFDGDVTANVKTVRRQVEQDHIVGSVAMHDPDFEFANFTRDELVEVAAALDDRDGYPGDLVRNADWGGVREGREFEDRYCKVSARGRKLKGESWVRRLGAMQ